MKILYYLLLIPVLVFGQIIDENYDGALPVEGLSWPSCSGETWNGWACPDYCEEGIYYDSSAFSTDKYHSSPRSMRVTRKAGYWGTPDMIYTLGQSYTTWYIDFWIYFDTLGFGANTASYNVPYDGGGVYLMNISESNTFDGSILSNETTGAEINGGGVFYDSCICI